MKFKGGKTVYGACLGILMLEAKFPRIPGDVGNAETWPFPVQYRVVPGATPKRVVLERAEDLLTSFINSAKDLVNSGADGITTNCGFLSLFQNEIAESVNVPVVTSSLMQVSLVNEILPPNKYAGILTISAKTLSKEHLSKANVPLETPIVGTDEEGEFSKVVLKNKYELDYNLAKQDILNASNELVNNDKQIGAIILECTNMVPFAADIGKAIGLPVFSIYNFILWFQNSLIPKRFNIGLDDPRL